MADQNINTPETDVSTERQSIEEQATVKMDAEPIATPDVHSTALKIQRAREVYKAYEGFDEKPTKFEVLGWCSYEFFSHFVLTVLIPIVFPLIICQIVKEPQEPLNGWNKSPWGLDCIPKEMLLYQRLTLKSITVSSSKISPLGWTSISWAIGLLLSAPILLSLSSHLNTKHQIISAAAIAVGSIFCLPAGFFKAVWIFPPYIAAIVVAHTIASTSHTRYLGLIVRGFTGPLTSTTEYFRTKTAVSSWISTYASASGSFSAAIISSFTYHMLREDEEFLSLWVVSIFSGLKWLVGISHVFITNRAFSDSANPNIPGQKENLSSTVFKYPHAILSLVGIFLSSFTTMCIFMGALLFIVGQLCFTHQFLLYFWLTYFIFPAISLPLLQPLQYIIKADAVKMQVMGFLLSLVTSGAGFYFRDNVWEKKHILIFAAIQSTSAGLLHAFGRVLLIDCSSCGQELAGLSSLFSWMKGVGMCIGFAVASAAPGNIRISFGVAYCVALFGVVLLIFGNIRDIEHANIERTEEHEETEEEQKAA